MTQLLNLANRFVWGAPALILILGVGIMLSVRTGWAQFRLFPAAMKAFFAPLFGKNQQSANSPYRALCTALAATVGTGNLAGVAGAIAIGGPGAVFWMWLCAILGMITKFSEAVLAVHYRVKDNNGAYIGGPMYVVKLGMGTRWQWLAGIYCFFGVVAAFGVGASTQVNAVIGGMNNAIRVFGGSESRSVNLLIGALLSVITVLVVFGGANRIGAAAAFLVPFASAFYLLMGAGVLVFKASEIPNAFYAIVKGAFCPEAVTGGVLASAFQALRVGASRGVFTNEAGMGTAGIAHASASVEHPVQQGLMGIVEVFVDTIVICTMTALVILCSGIPIPYGHDLGIQITADAFSHVYGNWIHIPLAISLCAFAIATIFGWGLYGARCAQFLFGNASWKWFVFLQAGSVMLGSVLNTGTVWSLSETANGLMAIPNLMILIILSPKIISLTREYLRNNSRKTFTGGTNENINQCKSVRTFPNAEVSSACSQSKKRRKDNISPEYRSA